MPALKRVLIDERDGFLAQKIRDTPGDCLVAVVGAGHVAGMKRALQSDERIDLDRLNEMPTTGNGFKIFGWAISAIILGSICLLYTSPSPRDRQRSRMPSSA